MNDIVTEVKLFQFSSDGSPHPEHNGQDQDEIRFSTNGRGFEAEVKGVKTTISFTESTFQFQLHRMIGGIIIRQQFNREGRVVVGGKETQLLLIQTPWQKNWRWALNDGTLLDFQSHRLNQ